MAISSHSGRSMAIDSLLNPQGAAEPDNYKSTSKLHYSPGPLTPQYSPLYPPSPNQYYYSFDNHGQHHHHHHHHHHHSPYSNDHGRTPSSQDSHSHHHHHSFNPYHHPSRSTASSPEPYHGRDRYDSVSSSSSTNGGGGPSPHGHHSSTGDRRRPPRPKYEEEEMYFIWYHRVDLCQEWKEVRESFNRQFPARQRSGFQGIQCKFYRFIKEKKCPTLREQRRMRDGEFLKQESVPTPASTAGGFHGGAPQFGVVEWMGVWYPWMKEDREEVMRKRLAR
ncbi:uncharacterized protein BDV14DRAFT_174611 [Aspergillus stella-maris]|uniref:uncharacterized protein n=1 Tax=Aspergillus stella-maris TaxID=1810926 RepID=UPI003CCE2B43